jgi:hypothetical protein
LTHARLAAVLLMTTVACEAVPVLHFESPDARDDADDARGASDAGTTPESSASKDAISSEDAVEAQSATGCPDHPPSGASCCDRTPCIGDCGEAGCESCVAKCGEQLCCAKSAASHQCRSLDGGCP